MTNNDIDNINCCGKMAFSACQHCQDIYLCASSFVLRCVNKNYKAVVFYPAIKVSRRKGFAYVAGMVGTFIEGANGKMQPALCGGHDIGKLRDTVLR